MTPEEAVVTRPERQLASGNLDEQSKDALGHFWARRLMAIELLRIATHRRPQQEPAKTPSPTRFSKTNLNLCHFGCMPETDSVLGRPAVLRPGGSVRPGRCERASAERSRVSSERGRAGRRQLQTGPQRLSSDGRRCITHAPRRGEGGRAQHGTRQSRAWRTSSCLNPCTQHDACP